MRETDDRIIDRVLKGERNAYALLVDKYKDRVFSLVIGIVRNKEIAEEVAQDIFVNAYTSLKKFRRESGFSTWLYRIAYNRAISETRKRRIPHRSFDEQLEKTASIQADEYDVETSEMRQKLLEKALEQLPAEEKLILMLYYFEDNSVEEISKHTGLTVSNVKVRLFRMRNKLKELMTRMGTAELVVY
jgi:RNA polymerase sigma-70 factor (ECF subfamily)